MDTPLSYRQKVTAASSEQEAHSHSAACWSSGSTTITDVQFSPMHLGLPDQSYAERLWHSLYSCEGVHESPPPCGSAGRGS